MEQTERIYNLITVLMLMLTGMVIVVVTALMFTRQPVTVEPVFPTAAFVPTATPLTPTMTFTASRTPLPPTWTDTPTETLTHTPTNTLTATITSSPTITDTPRATDTPSITPTPSVTDTFTPTVTPTGPTNTPVPSSIPYPFVMREQNPSYVPNTFNTLGCSWQGIGGQVLTADGQQFTQQILKVHVFSADTTFDYRVNTSTTSLYGGASGWEIKVSDSINNQTYFVQLETEIGTQISPRIMLQFPADCSRNVALINFIQQR